MGAKTVRINNKVVKTLSINNTIIYQKSSRLPDEYQEVEWIGTSGTQVLSSDVYSNNGGIYKAKIKRLTTGSSSRNLLGVASNNATTINAGAGSYFGWNTSGYWEMGGQVVSSVLASTDKFDEVEFEFKTTGTGTLTVNGVELLTRSGSVSLSNFLIVGGTSYPVHAQFKEIRTKATGSSSERIFIPCYRKADGVIGMYDITTKVFITNQGTGTFTKGGDV